MKNRSDLRLLALAAALSGASLVPGAFAAVRFPHLISDHAVLQRDRPIHLWGHSTAGAHLAAQFHNQTVATVADGYGRWSLYLAPETAGGPYTLTVSGDGAPATVADLLVGDVWFASGQSNMEIPLNGFGPETPIKDAAKEIAGANQPQIRLLLVDKKSSDFPLNDVPNRWTTCTPETAQHFSAVAYFFGREISAKEKVPIGLIDSTWGGTPADSWVSMDTLGSDPRLLPALASRARFTEGYGDLENTVAEEKRQDAEAAAAGRPAPSHPSHPEQGSWLPAGLYNGMIAPFAPLTIKGFLWYQGETNSQPGRAPYYRTLFPALIADWREHFAQGDLPFYFVQISSFHSPAENWGLVRDAQRRTLEVAHTAMVVTLDAGQFGNVHPPDKQTVAARLALAARHLTYGEDVAYQGPLYRETTTELQPDGSAALRIWFDHAEGLTSHGQPVTGFEVAGADHRFVPATARLEGTTAVVQAAAGTVPVYVRYDWASFVEHTLFNGEGLPTSTFTSERDPQP